MRCGLLTSTRARGSGGSSGATVLEKERKLTELKKLEEFFASVGCEAIALGGATSRAVVLRRSSTTWPLRWRSARATIPTQTRWPICLRRGGPFDQPLRRLPQCRPRQVRREQALPRCSSTRRCCSCGRPRRGAERGARAAPVRTAPRARATCRTRTPRHATTWPDAPRCPSRRCTRSCQLEASLRRARNELVDAAARGLARRARPRALARPSSPGWPRIVALRRQLRPRPRWGPIEDRHGLRDVPGLCVAQRGGLRQLWHRAGRDGFDRPPARGDARASRALRAGQEDVLDAMLDPRFRGGSTSRRSFCSRPSTRRSAQRARRSRRTRASSAAAGPRL